MKKNLFTVLLFLIVLFIIKGCSLETEIKVNLGVNLPKADKEERVFTIGEFQDYTDYYKLYYSVNGINKIKNNSKFREVTDPDILIIKEILYEYYRWVKDSKYENLFDFDIENQIKPEDYYFINYESYDDNINKVYYEINVIYLDVNLGILYYFHSNI